MNDLLLLAYFTTEPCSSYKYLSDSWRSPSVSGQSLKCDNTLVAGWYRLVMNGNNASNLLFSPPAMMSCSTHAPLWWNGKLP